MRYYGEIKWFGGINKKTKKFNDFGFITNIGDNQLTVNDIYFHESEVNFDNGYLKAGGVITFRLEKNNKRYSAKSIKLLEEEKEKNVLERCIGSEYTKVWAKAFKNYSNIAPQTNCIYIVRRKLSKITYKDIDILTRYIPEEYFIYSDNLMNVLTEEHKLSIYFTILDKCTCNTKREQEIINNIIKITNKKDILKNKLHEKISLKYFKSYKQLRDHLNDRNKIKIYSMILNENPDKSLEREILFEITELINKSNIGKRYILENIDHKYHDTIKFLIDHISSLKTFQSLLKKSLTNPDLKLKILSILKDNEFNPIYIGMIPETSKYKKIRQLVYLEKWEIYFRDKLSRYQLFKDEVDRLCNRRKIITDKEILDLKSNYRDIRKYFNNNFVYEYCNDSKEIIVNGDLDKINRIKLSQLSSEFISTKYMFQEQYNNLTLYFKKINSHILFNICKAKKFLNEISNIRINEDIKEYIQVLKCEYRDVYTYILKGTERDSIFESFINIYDRLEMILCLNQYLNNVYSFMEEVKKAKEDYIIHTFERYLKGKYKNTYLIIKNLQDWFLINKNKKYKRVIDEFINYYNNLEQYIKNWNKNFIQKELKKNKVLFDNVDGKSLDIQQRISIITDDINNLILAGAGSGKTLTISGKVKYLVYCKNIKPDEILLISFTRKSAEEMYKRIKEKLNIDVDVMTFHKLGLKIISEFNEARPDIYNDINRIISRYFSKEIYKDKEKFKMLIQFFGLYIDIPKDWEEFDNLAEYHDCCRIKSFETIKSKVTKEEYIKEQSKEMSKKLNTFNQETVKSLEEFIIANFLFLNGINYVYEQKYKYKTSDKKHRQYKPDFYLPDYDIYIEHFGINEFMRAPWLTKVQERKYINDLFWKRKIHKKYGTNLIETYSFYNKNGVLLEKLKEKLLNYGVEFKEVDYVEIFKKIYDNKKDRYFEQFKNLISTFILLFKSNRYNVDKFDEFLEQNDKIDNVFIQKRNVLFFKFIKPIYEYYERFLNKIESIDFNDMINYAVDIIKKEDIKLKYKYIIIDEYQDISMNRYKLIKEIKEKTKAKLMCVGDDWQSIFRFAGSDINLFKKFEEYFGEYELLKIEKTYRNSQELINIAGNFIKKNPYQMIKKLKSDKKINNPIKIYGCQYNSDEIVSALKLIIDDIVHFYGKYTEIMLLGRNNFDIEILKNDKMFSYIQKDDFVEVKYKKYPKLKIFFLTVHRSKGLESENVIIINATNNIIGFPNQISDDPVLSYVLTDSDNFQFAEERRLFYVALTRTKNRTYIISPENKMSVFVKELIDNHKVEYIYISDNRHSRIKLSCPKCIKGYLVIRNKKNNRFLGCSNYPICDYTTPNIDILNNPQKCEICGDYLLKRDNNLYICPNQEYHLYYKIMQKCKKRIDILL